MICALSLRSIPLRFNTTSCSSSFGRNTVSILRLVLFRASRSYSGTMATTMKEANTLKRVMEEGKGPSMGVWQTLPGSNLSRVIARCGFDWIVVDCEHGNIDDAAMHESVAAIAACGASPIVRIPDNQGWMVKRVLDAGAHGVIVPLLYTAEDAKKLVKSAKFPPIGQRGFGSPFSMERFVPSLGSSEYLKQANEALLTMVQIETKEALENVEAIAAIAGIDLLFVGPFDLGNNIGHPIMGDKMHDNLHAAIERIFKASKAAGKKTGIFCTSGEQSKTYADMGFDMISVALDITALSACLIETLNTAKGRSSITSFGGYGR